MPGNAFYLTGKFQALNAPGEWYLDGSKLYFWSPDGGVPQNVEVKARQYGFNLSGKSYINISNINLFGCSVIANNSNHITLSEHHRPIRIAIPDARQRMAAVEQ